MDNPELFSYECLSTVESLIDYSAQKDCLDYFKMPSQSVDEYICNEQYSPDTVDYKSTGNACTDKYDDTCFDYLGMNFTDEQCSSIYESLYKPQNEKDLFEKNFAVQCVRKEVDIRVYDWCMKEAEVNGELEALINPTEKHMQKMNDEKLKNYCKETFKDENPYNYVECMKYIGSPIGVDECFLLPEYNYLEDVNLFNYYQKYVCLSLKETVLDPEVNSCILGKDRYYPGYDMNFVKINECLRNYEEEPGGKMDLKKVGEVSIYKRLKTS